jgi:hypothetical protein
MKILNVNILDRQENNAKHTFRLLRPNIRVLAMCFGAVLIQTSLGLTVIKIYLLDVGGGGSAAPRMCVNEPKQTGAWRG